MPDTTHIYYEWQCATLMYAYDVIEPISRMDENAIAERKKRVEHEVYDLFVAVVPQEIRDNPQANIPAAAAMELTKATLRKAATICHAI
ncbi:MAG TPA: hypothetical protein PLD59_01835 [Tepidisphaeraceae bacterium]|nr:hypothetical protein [Tepidisphaeraceae bacterium]